VKFIGQPHVPTPLFKDRPEVPIKAALFVSRFSLQYILASFLLVAADSNKLQRKDSINIYSLWETYISDGTAAVKSRE